MREDVGARIERLSEERSAARSSGDFAQVHVLDREIAAAYEEKRAAAAKHGTPEARERVKKVARIDERLEKEALG